MVLDRRYTYSTQEAPEQGYPRECATWDRGRNLGGGRGGVIRGERGHASVLARLSLCTCLLLLTAATSTSMGDVTRTVTISGTSSRNCPQFRLQDFGVKVSSVVDASTEGDSCTEVANSRQTGATNAAGAWSGATVKVTFGGSGDAGDKCKIKVRSTQQLCIDGTLITCQAESDEIIVTAADTHTNDVIAIAGIPLKKNAEVGGTECSVKPTLPLWGLIGLGGAHNHRRGDHRWSAACVRGARSVARHHGGSRIPPKAGWRTDSNSGGMGGPCRAEAGEVIATWTSVY